MIRIRVNGRPAPQGSKRHVGAGRMVEASSAVGPWREAVRAETQRVIDAGAWPLTQGPVIGSLIFRLPRPASLPRKVTMPAKRPDLDKLTRAVLDGLVAGGALGDDGQVVDLCARKLYADDLHPAGCFIILDHYDDEEDA